jgi:1-carboxybiuret hydrolase
VLEAAVDSDWSTAGEIAGAIAAGRTNAVSVAEAAVARIRSRDPLLNSFTALTEERALERARAIDAAQASGRRRSPVCRSR